MWRWVECGGAWSPACACPAPGPQCSLRLEKQAAWGENGDGTRRQLDLGMSGWGESKRRGLELSLDSGPKLKFF